MSIIKGNQIGFVLAILS